MFNWGAIGKAVAGTIESGVGLYNRREAKKLKKRGEKLMQEAWDKRTDFEIPDEIRNNLYESRNQAYGKPAIQSYMEENADRSLANNISAVGQYATSSADAMAAAFAANQQAMAGRGEAAVAGAQARQQNMDRMYEAGNTLADYKSMAWDMNVNVPFLQRMQWAQDMIGSGAQGMNAGMNQFVQGQNQIGQSASEFFGGGGGGGGGGGMGGGMFGG